MTESDLQFDANGFLLPHGPIQCDMLTVERVFVERFIDSETRRNLFDRYRAFNTVLTELLPEGYTQWIDGSFVSQKQNPNDIDVVTFVNADLYNQHEKQFDALRDWRNQRPKTVDGFFVRYYPENHRYRVRYDYDCIGWLNTFGTWKDRTLKTHDKGFITINF